jgi:hypothetical protein
VNLEKSKFEKQLGKYKEKSCLLLDENKNWAINARQASERAKTFEYELISERKLNKKFQVDIAALKESNRKRYSTHLSI